MLMLCKADGYIKRNFQKKKKLEKGYKNDDGNRVLKNGYK